MHLLGGRPRDHKREVWKQSKGIRIRESLNKLRCQRPDNFSDDDYYDRSGGGGTLSLSGTTGTGSWAAPEAAGDEHNEKFSNRYDITIMHTHKDAKAPLGDANDSPLSPLLPPKQRDGPGGCMDDQSTTSDEATASLDDSLLTDWETDAWVFPRVADNISHGGDETLGYDEYSTVPSMSTRHYYTNGVVDDVVDVFDDFTYFFRCLRLEAQNQLVEASSSMHCGG